MGWVSIVNFLSLVIVSPADVDVADGGDGGSFIGQRFLIQIMLEDGLDATVAGATDGECPFTGGFQTLIAVAFGHPQHSQAASEALLGHRSRVQDGFDELGRLRSDLFSPMDKALRCPFGPFLVGFGHVFFDGGMPPLLIASDVTGHPFVFVKAFDGSGRDAHIELFCDQLMGHTVIMPLDFDVIVDSLIKLVQAEELAVSYPGQDPAFNNLYAGFHLGLGQSPQLHPFGL